jgi:hypothetical protein
MAMNPLEDPREIVTNRTELSSRDTRNRALERAFEFGRMIEHLLRQYPDIDPATIRLWDESPATINVAGRRGPLAPTAGAHLVHSEAFIDQDDPRYQPNPEAR